MATIYDDFSSDMESVLTSSLQFTKPTPLNKTTPKNMNQKNKRKLQLPRTTQEEANEILKKSFNTGIIIPIKDFHIECIPEFTGRQLNYKNADCPAECKTHMSLSNYLSHFPKLLDLVTFEEVYVLRDDFQSKQQLTKLMLNYVCRNDFQFLKKILKNKRREIENPVFSFLEELKKQFDWAEIVCLEKKLKKFFKTIDSLKIDAEKIDLNQFYNKDIVNIETAVRNHAKLIVQSIIYDYEIEMILVNLLPMKSRIRLDDLWPMIATSFDISAVDVMNFKRKIYEMESKNILTKITKTDEYAEIIPIYSVEYSNYGDLERVKTYLSNNGVSRKSIKALKAFEGDFLHKTCLEIYETLNRKSINIDIPELNMKLNSLYPDLIDLMDDTYELSSYKRDDVTVDLTSKELLWTFYMKEIEQTEKECKRVGIAVGVNSNNIFKRHHN